MWINEIEPAMSIADLESSCAITGAKLQTNFEVVGAQVESGLKKFINGDVKRKVFIQEEELHKKKSVVSQGGMSDE